MALDTFAVRDNEAEITTLPGTRFMVLDRKIVPNDDMYGVPTFTGDHKSGKRAAERFELKLLMLPPDPTYVSNLTKKEA